ncbi:uncharacterized protein N0V89_011068 [Didymosphaeria variabile]|uniref:Azaphilone pigments biosynthesis cluster protein L N-terminal domain-containing protein n=1 Tax=Didymosphaeria variabile TaxID=1932322 RepID=A0A9W8XCH5_9PLEO|nr:uncharacterized protein N0V89_011068 [Didymosphaeria variabile]KAJ4347130.1 hypothetical protein N0V89_011068 [Didymosphaeria variabile]
MDPLSITAAIASLAVPAIQCASHLSAEISSLVKAPQIVQSLKDDVSSTEAVLISLQGIQDSEWEALGPIVADQSKVAIKNCEKACEGFRVNLQSWTKHSKEGQLYSSIRHSYVTEDIRRKISTSGVEVSSALGSAKTQLAGVEREMGRIRLEDTADDADNREDTKNTIRQLQEERAALQCSRKMLEELQQKAREDAVMQAANQNQGRLHNITLGGTVYGQQNAIVNGGTWTQNFGYKPT